MKRKKLLAGLTALICLASSVCGFTVYAEDETTAEGLAFELVVIAMDNSEDPQDYYLINTSTSYNYAGSYVLYNYEITKHLGDEKLQYGDIVQLYGDWSATELWGTNSVFAIGKDEGTYLKVAGTIFDMGQPENYTVMSASNLVDNAGVVHRTFLPDYVHYENFDWKSIKSGDIVSMLTYKDVPCIPVEFTPLGDVNADSVLNVLDVVTMNKHLLTGAELPALANASGEAKLAKSGEPDLGQCDFNGNGVIDPDDSLCMLKRIVGLETIEVE